MNFEARVELCMCAISSLILHLPLPLRESNKKRQQETTHWFINHFLSASFPLGPCYSMSHDCQHLRLNCSDVQSSWGLLSHVSITLVSSSFLGQTSPRLTLVLGTRASFKSNSEHPLECSYQHLLLDISVEVHPILQSLITED